MMDKCQVFGDGNNFTIIFKDIEYYNSKKTNEEHAWIFIKPIVQSIQSNFDNDLIEPTYTIGGLKPHLMNLKGRNIMVNIDMVVEDVKIKNGKNLMMDLDMFKNIKVSELFSIINKKLKEREK